MSSMVIGSSSSPPNLAREKYLLHLPSAQPQDAHLTARTGFSTRACVPFQLRLTGSAWLGPRRRLVVYKIPLPGPSNNCLWPRLGSSHSIPPYSPSSRPSTVIQRSIATSSPSFCCPSCCFHCSVRLHSVAVYLRSLLSPLVLVLSPSFSPFPPVHFLTSPTCAVTPCSRPRCI